MAWRRHRGGETICREPPGVGSLFACQWVFCQEIEVSEQVYDAVEASDFLMVRYQVPWWGRGVNVVEVSTDE